MSTGIQQKQTGMFNIHDIRYNQRSGLLPQFEDRNYVATVDVIRKHWMIPEGGVVNVMIWRDNNGKQIPVLIQGDEIICYENSWTCKNCFKQI